MRDAPDRLGVCLLTEASYIGVDIVYAIFGLDIIRTSQLVSHQLFEGLIHGRFYFYLINLLVRVNI